MSNSREYSIYQCDCECDCGNCYKFSEVGNSCGQACQCREEECDQCVCYCWASAAVRFRDDWDFVPANLSTHRPEGWPDDILPLDLQRWRHILVRHAPGSNQGVDEFPEYLPIADAICATILRNERTPGRQGEIWVRHNFRGTPIKVVLSLDRIHSFDGTSKFVITAYPDSSTN
jgi:hypothetical protein